MSRRGIVLGRERSYEDSVAPANPPQSPSFSVLKLPKNNVGRQRPRTLRWKATALAGGVALEVTHPDKPQKNRDLLLSDIGDITVNTKERRVRVTLTRGEETDWRFIIASTDAGRDVEAFVQTMQRLKVPHRALCVSILPQTLEGVRNLSLTRSTSDLHLSRSIRIRLSLKEHWRARHGCEERPLLTASKPNLHNLYFLTSSA